MKILSKSKLSETIAQFNFVEKVTFVDFFEYEPDCVLYFFTSGDKNFVLICRDFLQDDLAAEKRILREEMKIKITKNFTTRATKSYWLKEADIDSFEYIFSLVAFEWAEKVNFSHTH